MTKYCPYCDGDHATEAARVACHKQWLRRTDALLRNPPDSRR